MLSGRRQQILNALVEEYVSSALPVASQTIARHYHLGVSSATIRNELSYLESEGYISQPHTSAGRIPTDLGYREIVNALLGDQENKGAEAIKESMQSLRKNADVLDDLIEQVSHELTRITECLSVVMPPSHAASPICSISAISLSDTAITLVVVLKDGQVASSHIMLPYPVSRSDIANINQKFSRLFVDKTLDDISSNSNEIANTLSGDELSLFLLRELVSLLKKTSGAKASRTGFATLMKKPEFRHSESLLPVMQILEDGPYMFHSAVANAALRGRKVVVRIGSENASDTLSGVSVVAGAFGHLSRQGIIAVIGPTRMNYSNAIIAVRAAQDVLEDEL